MQAPSTHKPVKLLSGTSAQQQGNVAWHTWSCQAAAHKASPQAAVTKASSWQGLSCSCLCSATVLPVSACTKANTPLLPQHHRLR